MPEILIGRPSGCQTARRTLPPEFAIPNASLGFLVSLFFRTRMISMSRLPSEVIGYPILNPKLGHEAEDEGVGAYLIMSGSKTAFGGSGTRRMNFIAPSSEPSAGFFHYGRRLENS